MYASLTDEMLTAMCGGDDRVLNKSLSFHSVENCLVSHLVTDPSLTQRNFKAQYLRTVPPIVCVNEPSVHIGTVLKTSLFPIHDVSDTKVFLGTVHNYM